MLYIFIIGSLIILILMFKLLNKYILFDGIKGTFVAILYIIFSVCYLGILNPKSKLHFLYGFFDLHNYPEYYEYIEYFTSFMIFTLLLQVLLLNYILYIKKRFIN